MLLLSVKGKEATFAVELMAADSELRKRHMEVFGGNTYLHPSPLPHKIVVDRNPLERTLKICGRILGSHLFTVDNFHQVYRRERTWPLRV